MAEATLPNQKDEGKSSECVFPAVAVCSAVLGLLLTAALWGHHDKHQDRTPQSHEDYSSSFEAPLLDLHAKRMPGKFIKDKPRGDARTYMYATLANGLQVLTVQDNRSKFASMAMAVQAGSYDDPKDLPGLMHFCEHMLFLGTTKYPDPDDFERFINRQGGGQNAYTANEVTVYYANLQAQAADEGFDRFSRFFREPTFDEQYVRKETSAIDQEHGKNVQDPGRRVGEVMRHLSRPGSVVGKFATGSHETLKDRDGKPKTTEALKEQFRKLYCPSKMRLVVFGPRDNELQMGAAAATFGDIGANDESCRLTPRKSYADEDAWPAERLGKWVDILGIVPQSSLWIMFSLPDQRPYYASKPLEYLNWAINFEGKGSLLALLRDHLGLAESVGISDDSHSTGTMLYFIIALTPAGAKMPDKVLHIIFAYLAMLQDKSELQKKTKTQESLFDIDSLFWNWAEPSGPTSTAEDLADAMTWLPDIEEILWADSVPRKHQITMALNLIRELRPEKANVGFVDPREFKDKERFKSDESADVQTLEYYGVSYVVRNLEHVLPKASEDWNRWLNEGPASAVPALTKILEKEVTTSIPDSSEAEKAMPLVLPPAVPALPGKLNFQDARDTSSRKAETLDEALFGHAPGRLQTDYDDKKRAPHVWFRRGWMSNAPIGSPRFSISVLVRPLKEPNAAEASAIDNLRASLWTSELLEELQPLLAVELAAGGSCSVSVSADGVSLGLGGFTPWLDSMAEKLFSHLDFNLRGRPRPWPSYYESFSNRFDRLKTHLKQDLENNAQMPIKRAIADRNLLIVRGGHSRAELLKALDGIDEEFALRAAKELFIQKPHQLMMLSMGAIGEEETKKIGNKLTDLLHGWNDNSANGEIQHLEQIINLKIPVELRAKNPRPNDPNDVFVMTILAGVATPKLRVQLGLIGDLLGQTTFSELRTAERLGYVVDGAAGVLAANVMAISIMVQGTTARADVVEAHALRVLSSSMVKVLSDMPDQEFKYIKSSFEFGLRQDPFHTEDEVGHFFTPLATASGCFKLREEMLKHLNALRKEDLLATWKSIVMPTDAAFVRPKLVVKYFSVDEKGNIPQPPTDEEAEQVWKVQHVPEDQFALLRRERKQTMPVTLADSEIRQKVLKEAGNGYFPPTLDCGPVDEAATRPDDFKPSAAPGATSALERSASNVDQPKEQLSEDFLASRSIRQGKSDHKKLLPGL